jgi:hypothetical protein
MRAFLILVAIVLVFALVGWISFSKGPGRASINLETEEIREDTQHAMQSGGELLHKAGDKMQNEANRPPETASQPQEPAPVTR